MRVTLADATTAEYFLIKGQDVLLFSTALPAPYQAGHRVSTLLGRMPSAVGYQPTLAEMGELQGSILLPRKEIQYFRTGSYVLRTTLRPCSCFTTFTHLDTLPFFLVLLLPSLVFTQQLILWPAPVLLIIHCWFRGTPPCYGSSGRPCREYSDPFRTSLQFWVWTRAF